MNTSGVSYNLRRVTELAADLQNRTIADVTTAIPMNPSSESIGANHGGIRSGLRDDRLLLFIDHLEKKRDWKFSMRAVTAGHFVLPPIVAEGMYLPGTNSVTSASEITVTTN